MKNILLLLVMLASPAYGGGATRVRPAAVAGSFYPADKVQLEMAVTDFLQTARTNDGPPPVAIVAPHAGYVFAGQIIADAWQQAAGGKYDLIVILGTDHTQPPFDGISVYDGSAYETPLGRAALDREVIRKLLGADPRFVFKPAVHEREHSVEVQVPFAQHLFPGVKLVCAVVGRSDPRLCEDLGHLLAQVVQGHRVLLVASSDLSHYPDHQTANRVDRATLTALASLNPRHFLDVTRKLEHKHPDLATCACGKAPVMVVMTTAGDLGAHSATVVSYANSGDTSLGDPERCVGYGAMRIDRRGIGPDLRGLPALPEDQRPPEANKKLNPQARRWLLDFARRTLEQYLATGTAPLARDYPQRLGRMQGSFVTLTTGDHRLRGCIGHLQSDMPLAVTVGRMAIQAAVHDPRFDPLGLRELRGIKIEISVLSMPQPVAGPDRIVLGRDGVILTENGHSAVYLPQVAPEQGWNLEQTLSHLSRKAGLPGDAWRKGAAFQTFQAQVFTE